MGVVSVVRVTAGAGGTGSEPPTNLKLASRKSPLSSISVNKCHTCPNSLRKPKSVTSSISLSWGGRGGEEREREGEEREGGGREGGEREGGRNKEGEGGERERRGGRERERIHVIHTQWI